MQKNSRHLIWHTFKSRRSFPYEAYQISTWFILNAYLACFLILPKSHFWVLARQESRFCRTLIKDEGIMQRLHIRQMHSGRILNKSVWGLMGKGKFLVQSSCISCLTSSICTDPYSWLGKVTQHYCKHMTLKHEWSDGVEACAACLCILTTAGFVYERSEGLHWYWILGCGSNVIRDERLPEWDKK